MLGIWFARGGEHEEERRLVRQGLDLCCKLVAAGAAGGIVIRGA